MAEPRQEPQFASHVVEPRREARFTPQVVASIEQAVAARRGGKSTDGSGEPDARAADQLLSAMRTVKAARFNCKSSDLIGRC